MDIKWEMKMLGKGPIQKKSLQNWDIARVTYLDQ